MFRTTALFVAASPLTAPCSSSVPRLPAASSSSSFLAVPPNGAPLQRRRPAPAVARRPRVRAPPVCMLPAAPPAITSLVNPQVLRTSFSAISKLLATLLLGVLAASRGLLDAATMTALSRTVYHIFLPSLLFTNIVRTLSLPLPPGLFMLPLAAVAQVAMGFLFAFIGSTLLRLTPRESRLYAVCTAFGNSAALPLLFANSLFAGSQSLPNLIASVSFFLLGWTGLFWSIAYSLLVSAAKMPADGGGGSGESQLASEEPQRSTAERLRVFAKRVFTPPLLASFSALFVGLAAPVRNALMGSPLFPALCTLATGYAPAAVLILAGSLARAAAARKKAVAGGAGDLRIGRMVAGISVTRFVLMPLFGFALVKYGPYRAPFVALAVLLQAVMPSAQNGTLILNMENQPDMAAKVATVLLSVYLIGVVPISIALTLFLAYTGVGY